MIDFCNELDLRVVGICETWLSPDVALSVISVEGYTLIRNDSPSGQRKYRVCMYVHNNLKIGHVYNDHVNTVGVFLPSIGIHILNVYRPPSNTAAQDQELVAYLEGFCQDREVCIMGDFNLPSIDWVSTPPVVGSARDRVFSDCFTYSGLTQHVYEATFIPSGRILDLIFTSDHGAVSTITLLPPLPACGHTPISFAMAFSDVDQACTGHTRGPPLRNWFGGDFLQISRSIDEVDWVCEFSGRSLQQAYAIFNSHILRLVDLYIPLRAPPNKNNPPWNKNIPNHLRSSKAITWQDYKSARTAHGRLSALTLTKWHGFQQVLKMIKDFKTSSRYQYEINLLDDLDQNPKKFHWYLRQQKSDRPKVGPLMCEGTLTDDPLEMAEQLVTSYHQVLTQFVPPDPHNHQTSNYTLSAIDFTIHDVDRALSALDPSSSMGPDLVHPILLKTCHTAVSLPLYLLFRESLSSMTVPSLWKTSNVTPIYKKGAHSDPLNYRPISLTSVCCKTMERILAVAMDDYLADHDLLSNSQFGFRPGRSVQDQLLLTYDYISNEYDQGKIVELILFDFSKAFDLIPHRVIVEKLGLLGFRDPILGWIGDFLRGRDMRVVISGCSSSPRPVTSGVPQGSVLGPLLFIIFINHLIHDLQTFAGMFADDLKIYLGVPRDPTSYSIGVQSLQSDINILSARSSSWGLTFAPHKCIRLRFARPYRANPIPLPLFLGDTQLFVSDSARDLGVMIDSDLRFHNHTTLTSAKALGVSINILRGTICRTPEFMKTVFISQIRPILDFCSSVWNLNYI